MMAMEARVTAVETQRRILQFLRRHGETSLSELRQGLGLSHVTILRHLDDLMQQGMVSPPEQRRRGGPGRPEHAYSATSKADGLLPANYKELALAVLGALDSKHGPEWVRKLLREAGTSAASGLGLPEDRAHMDFMPQMLAGLEKRGYLPSIGTWSGRRCLTFAHCPYLDAARASPAVCAFDQALLEGLLAEPIVLFRRIAEHDPQCIFLLGA
jgi:predicted ArsR family transcriptional regulator